MARRRWKPPRNDKRDRQALLFLKKKQQKNFRSCGRWQARAAAPKGLTVNFLYYYYTAMDECPWFENISIPALLRHARATYGAAMRRALQDAGYDDLPANGLYVIGGLAFGAGDVPLGHIIEDLRMSKQAAGQLIDTLVTRGYLARSVDEDDRRKLTIILTERGRAAAQAQAEGRQKIDQELTALVGPTDVICLRRTLAVLADLGRQDGAAASD